MEKESEIVIIDLVKLACVLFCIRKFIRYVIEDIDYTLQQECVMDTSEPRLGKTLVLLWSCILEILWGSLGIVVVFIVGYAAIKLVY
jgi:hypothetical protein